MRAALAFVPLVFFGISVFAAEQVLDCSGFVMGRDGAYLFETRLSVIIKNPVLQELEYLRGEHLGERIRVDLNPIFTERIHRMEVRGTDLYFFGSNPAYPFVVSFNKEVVGKTGSVKVAIEAYTKHGIFVGRFQCDSKLNF